MTFLYFFYYVIFLKQNQLEKESVYIFVEVILGTKKYRFMIKKEIVFYITYVIIIIYLKKIEVII